MSWRTFARKMAQAQRRSQREFARHQRQFDRDAAGNAREHQKWLREQEKRAAKAEAADEVRQYEAYVAMLVSVHHTCVPPADWSAVAQSPPPPEPTRSDAVEQQALQTMHEYRPTFFDRLFGGAKAKQQDLWGRVLAARANDDQQHAGAIRAWQERVADWQDLQRTAQLVLQRNPHGYEPALVAVGAFAEVVASGTTVRIGGFSEDAAVFKARLEDPEVVPTEVVKLTATGKLTTRDMPKSEYWLLFQDHVCSCAIRIACDAMATLAVRRVIVNVCVPSVDKSTGHDIEATYLAVHFTYDKLGSINRSRVDPSDAVSQFTHRMKFSKTQGFKPVDPMDLDENFITA